MAEKMSLLKRGENAQANIIVVVLIILLVLASIIIIWNIVRKTINQNIEEVSTGALTMGLNIEEVLVGSMGGIDVIVNRGVGKGELTELKFILEDINGQTYIETVDENFPEELGTKTYNVFSSLGVVNAKKISVMPVVGDRIGIGAKKDINNFLVTGTGLVSWWKLNGDAKDSVRENHGTVHGATWVDDSERGNVASFDGVDDNITIGNLGSFYSQGTLSFWVNALELANYRNLLTTKYSGFNNAIRFEENSLGDFSVVTGNSDGYDGATYISSGMSTNTWYHIVYIWDTSTNWETGFLNGTQVFSNIHSSWPTTIPDLRFGTGFSTEIERQWKGLIDDVMIFNKALSQNEVKAIYDNQIK